MERFAKRIKCTNRCGREISLRYNPDGICRKCKKILNLRTLKKRRKEERASKNS